MVMPGGNLGNPQLSQMFSQLGFETSKLMNEFGNVKFSLDALQEMFVKASQQAASGGPPPFTSLGSLSAKLAYIAVLQAAIEKAGSMRNFNVQTAINDLWIHLDAVKELEHGALIPPFQGAGDGGSSGAMRLESMLPKRKQMFDIMSKILKDPQGTKGAGGIGR